MQKKALTEEELKVLGQLRVFNSPHNKKNDQRETDGQQCQQTRAHHKGNIVAAVKTWHTQISGQVTGSFYGAWMTRSN
jgi:hypothetical protein